MLNIHIYILSACVLKFAVYCVCLWMSPCRIPYLDHRSISQWKTSTPPIRVHVYWNSLCLWMSPAEFQNWITDLFPSRKPRYLPVSVESYSTCRRCIRVYTVVLIGMTMYVWPANDAGSWSDWKFNRNKSGGACSERRRKVPVNTPVRSKTRTHWGFPLFSIDFWPLLMLYFSVISRELCRSELIREIHWVLCQNVPRIGNYAHNQKFQELCRKLW